MSAQTWLAIFLDRYKWYQSNLATQCGAKALHGMDPNKDVMDLSGQDCDILESQSHFGNIIKLLMSTKFHIDFLLGGIEFYK